MFKRLLSSVLALSMLPALSAYATPSKEYDASIFNNNAEYLLEEHFESSFIFSKDDANYRRPSGWDVDYRGGKITTSGYSLQLVDESETEEISLKREILPATCGTITYETAVTFTSAASAEFSLFIGSEDSPILNLFFNNQKVYNVTGSKKTSLTNIKAHVPIYVKAEISMDNEEIHLYIDNTDSGTNDYEGTLSFTNSVAELKNISFHTGKTSHINTKLHYVNIYQNFMVNEKFMTDPIGDVPEGFSLSPSDTGSGITDAPGSTYKDDENGFLLKNTEDDPEVSLIKTFDNSNNKTTVSWTMLMPEIQNGFYARIASESKSLATIYTASGKLLANGQLAESSLTPNLWYTVSADIDTAGGTYDLMLNKRTVLKDIPLYGSEIPTKISFTKQDGGTIGEMLIDDIEVTPTFEKYDDYPEAPVKAESDGVDAGMVMYPMWREGMHYGWDTISPYADERKPLMGYYTEGQKEVADWQNKWLIEHGIDFAIYPFVRPSEYKVNDPLVGEPIKSPVRGEDLMDGYMHSFYKDDLDFAIMLSQFSTDRYINADDFIEYAVPYIKEYYFKNPSYKVINNKLPIFNYSIGNTSNAIGGYQGIQKITDALDTAAKELGYDGIIFCADAATNTGHTIVNNINRDYLRVWNYTKAVGDVNVLKSEINKEYAFDSNYIPSISVGFDDTPWRESSSDMMNASDVKELCSYVKNHAKFQAEPEKMVVFTCWNEFGEGHFFSPSAKEGFGYLNAIRDVFTSAGVKNNEETPSEESIARMEVLYPNGRGALKLLNDKPYSETDIESREVLYRYDFTSSNIDDWSEVNCNVSMNGDTLKGTTSSTNPYIRILMNNDTGVDLSEVRAVKIRMYQKGGHNMQFFYYTTDYTAGNNPGTNEFGEFLTTSSISGNGEYKDYILKFNSEAGQMTGNLNMFKIRLSDDVHSSGEREFGIDYFELLGDPKSVEPIGRIDFTSPEFANCVAQEKDGAIHAEASAYDPQLKFTNIDKTIDMSKVKAVKIKAFTQGTNELRVYYGTNGNVTYPHSPYKFTSNSIAGDGSFREYTLVHDPLGSNPAPTGKLTSLRIDPSDNAHELGKHFGIDWIEFYDQEIYDDTYPVSMTIDGDTVRLTSPIQVKNKNAYIPIYSILLDELDAYVVWHEPTQTLTAEKEGKTISVTAGSNIAIINGKETQWELAPFYDKGNIFVPCEEFFAALGYAADFNDIARIVTCVKESEQEFKTSVTEERYDVNIAPNFWTAAYNDYFINGSSINGSNLSSITETIDGEKAIKITPPSGAGTDALFVCRYVDYEDQHVTLKHFVSQGTRMKVSFSYKGVGTRLEVTSREAGGGNTQQAPNAEISSTEWKTFEYVFDNSKIPVTSEARWVALRLKTVAGTDPYLYVKDFKISYPEEKSVTTFSDGELKISVQAPTGSRTSIPYTCYIAEYNDDCLVKMVVAKEGTTSDAGDYTTYYNYTPKNGNRIKVFLWNGFDPLYELTTLTRE